MGVALPWPSILRWSHRTCRTTPHHTCRGQDVNRLHPVARSELRLQADTHRSPGGGRTDGHHLRQSCPVGRGEGAGESSRTAVAASPSCELTREVDHHAVREKQFTIAGDSIRSASESRHHASGGVGRGLSAAVTPPTYDDAAVAGGVATGDCHRDGTTDGRHAPCRNKQTHGGAKASTAHHTTPRGFIACHTVGLIFSASGGPNVIDPIEASFVNYIRPQLGPNSKNCQIHESSRMSSRVKPV